MFDYAGSIHFHSAYSYDARVPLPDILKDAARTNLRFAVVTDHFRLDAREGSAWKASSCAIFLERWWAKKILVRATIIYLALGIQNVRAGGGMEIGNLHAQRIDRRGERSRAASVLSAIPITPELRSSEARAYPWISWDVHSYAGIGLWDLMSDWNASLSTPWSTLLACLRPAHVLRGPSPKTLARWDELTQKNHCVAIGELDNHAHRRSFFGFARDIFSFCIRLSARSALMCSWKKRSAMTRKCR